MPPIRITAPIVQYGSTQLPQNLVLDLPKPVTDLLIAEGSAETVPQEEYATMRQMYEVAVLHPKPPKRGKR